MFLMTFVAKLAQILFPMTVKILRFRQTETRTGQLAKNESILFFHDLLVYTLFKFYKKHCSE